MQGLAVPDGPLEQRHSKAKSQLRSMDCKNPFVRELETPWAPYTESRPPSWTICYDTHRDTYVMRKMWELLRRAVSIPIADIRLLISI